MASLLSLNRITARVGFRNIGKKILAITGIPQKRNLNVLEHISYTLLNDAGIPTPEFGVATTPQEAKEIAESLDTPNLVLKAQVLAGGRGMGTFKSGLKGGVRMVSTPEEAEQIAGKMINQLLVTKQTGPEGRICNKVMVTERKFPRKEYYIAVMMERAFNGPVIIASSQGGVNIEEVAAHSPEAIIYAPIDLKKGLQDEIICKIIKGMGLQEHSEMVTKTIRAMYDLFLQKDALLIEINPFAEDAMCEKKFFALDAKFRFDDNAEFRQKELFEMRDLSQEDPGEVKASKFGMSYITLDGTIGCMVNGAGLAMATMDIIKLYGGDPANFLDVGGAATENAVKEAFKIITSDSKVRCVLVNIFGGIMHCDIIAKGIISASKELKTSVPVVVRLLGVNVKEAQELIASSGMKIISTDELDVAVEKAVKLAQIVSLARELNLEINFEFPGGKKKKSSGGGGKYKSPCDRAKKKDECKKEPKCD